MWKTQLFSLACAAVLGLLIVPPVAAENVRSEVRKEIKEDSREKAGSRPGLLRNFLMKGRAAIGSGTIKEISGTTLIVKDKDGKVVTATAEKNEEALNKILDVDKGGRFIGELGIGNNFAISRFTKDILFDEKIGGSIHIALGAGYEETGSKNKSALHWDMIKDLREGGELWFDDKLVQKNGRWLIKL